VFALTDPNIFISIAGRGGYPSVLFESQDPRRNSVPTVAEMVTELL
jgi:hypothetical protein